MLGKEPITADDLANFAAVTMVAALVASDADTAQIKRFINRMGIEIDNIARTRRAGNDTQAIKGLAQLLLRMDE
jgi:phosphate uptake regulator